MAGRTLSAGELRTALAQYSDDSDMVFNVLLADGTVLSDTLRFVRFSRRGRTILQLQLCEEPDRRG